MKSLTRRCRGRRAVALAFLLVVGRASLAGAQESGPTAGEIVASGHVSIRTRVEPEKPVFVGQPIKLWVEVLTRTWFLEAPRFPAVLEVENAIVVPPTSFGVNSTEKIGGETYAVQGRAYSVFPQTTGRFEVPPVEVVLVVALDGAARSPEIPLRTEPLVVDANRPPGTEGLGPVLATERLTVTESYDRSLDGLQVGDAFQRTVTQTIDASVAMLLAPMRFEAADGIATYPALPDVTDQRERGAMTGRRVDSASYVLEKEGGFTIPATEIRWWDLGSNRLVTETLPAVELSVAANPDLAAEHLGGTPEEEIAEGGGEVAVAETTAPDWRTFGLAALLLVAAVFAGRRLLRWSRVARERPGALERRRFRSFRRAALAGDPARAHAALLAWLDCRGPVGATPTLGDLVDSARDLRLAEEVADLQRVLFAEPPAGSAPTWSGRQLDRSVRRARRALNRAERSPREGRRGLATLNP